MNLSRPPKIIVIAGPTAAGKTALSIELARRFGGEIVSADSRQVYRGMDIGTAKPTVEERNAVPHHLIDIKNPDEEYAVAEYKCDAIGAIRDILRRGRLPILSGGTGLYLDAVLRNLDIPSVKADPALRMKIEMEIREKGLEAVFRKLVALDPEAAYVVDPRNPRRVVRALEVALATGTPFTAQRKKNAPLFRALRIGLNPPGTALRERINARVEQMVRDGLLGEVETLVRSYGPACHALDAIGYREMIRHLEGELMLARAVELIQLDTWHYARRQMTWFRRDKEIQWIRDPQETVPLVQAFLGNPASQAA